MAKIVSWLCIGLILTSAYGIGYGAAKCVYTSTAKVEQSKNYCIVIDPGHGAMDPGKVGSQGTLEKDVNLAIAKKLKFFLEQQDFEVYLTREDDTPLYSESSDNKKHEDMKNRVKMVENCHADLVVSIHQNSYDKKSVKGAQSFYYSGSTEGKALAEAIQNQLLRIDSQNHRATKPNKDYYLLKKIKQPMVIVECGFLSNPEEENKLVDELYQEKVAWKIQMGILNYLATKEQ